MNAAVYVVTALLVGLVVFAEFIFRASRPRKRWWSTAAATRSADKPDEFSTLSIAETIAMSAARQPALADPLQPVISKNGWRPCASSQNHYR
jgi:hypothetical protein